MLLVDAYNHVQSTALYACNKRPNLDYTDILNKFYLLLKTMDLADVELEKWANGYAVGTLVHSVLSLPEYVTNGYGHQEVKMKNHCLIEIFRTPETERPTVYNILKIAFYAGLVRSNLKVRDFPDGIVKLFLDFKVYTPFNFMEKSDPSKSSKSSEPAEPLTSIPDDFPARFAELFVY